MKIVMGIIPCKDRMFLDRALLLAKPGIDELTKLADGEYNSFDVVTDLYVGVKQLEMIYIINEDVPEDRDQFIAITRLMSPEYQEGYAGFSIIEFQKNSLHVFCGYLLPQFRHTGIFTQCAEKMEKQARLVGAPYLSLCTAIDEPMLTHFGYKKTYITYRKKL